ncbi:MAG: hypothetical protein ABSF12_04995 [Bryobacteraceae bacterium]
MEFGIRPVLSTATVSVTGAPGNTTPLAGFTVIHGAPAATAVNVTGPPVVVRISVCVAGGSGGVMKLSAAELRTSVGSGASTVSVTGMVSVLENPAAEN